VNNASADSPVAYLTRRYEFAASHRLHNAAFSEAENWRIYGKCNYPHGHGHNYGLEVTVGGPVDAQTGMVVNLADLDRVVQEEILERFDHRNLNVEVESFRDRVPTSENLVLEIHRLLSARWTSEPALAGSRLVRVRLQETGKNFFEYAGLG
jgi:6-pyruvoyltetrahydropterin/6-carboxytetrahydropterin synthase